MKKIFLISMVITLFCTCVCAYANNDWDGTWDGSYIYVATTYVNVRSQPNTNCQIVGALTRNMIIPGGQAVNGWVPVNYYGYTRYVYSAYLKQTAKPLNQCSIKTLIGNCRTTGYDLCVGCCGKYPGSYGYGMTASGTYAMAGRTAAIKGYPYGSRIYIEGVGYRINEDTGGFGYNHIDIFCNNHTECYGVSGYKNVYLVQ